MQARNHELLDTTSASVLNKLATLSFGALSSSNCALETGTSSLGGLASSHLLSSGGGSVRLSLLLLKEGPGFVSLLLEVLHVGDQLDGVDDAVVVEEHASDLASGVTVLGGDELVDSVTNLLTLLVGVKGVETAYIDRGELGLGLLHGLHLLLLDLLSLLGGHSLGHGALAWLLLNEFAASTLTVHVAGATTVVVELAALAVVALTLVSTLALVVATLAIGTLAHLAAVVLHAVVALAVGAVEVFHEVLLHFLEATLLAFLVELVSGHPELDGEGACTEGRGLVEALNGSLGGLDVFVEDKVLAVGGVGVEVLALAQLDRDNGTNLLKEGRNLLSGDFGRDVFNKEV